MKEAQDYAQEHISSISTTPPTIVSPEASSSGSEEDSDDTTNTTIPSNDADIVALKLQQNEFALKLKKEEKKLKLGKNTSLESLPKAHREHYEKWIKANTDARTGKGRFVFRRATGPEGKEKQPSIVEVLGGSGMDPWPIVKNARNPQFVADHEFFVAGRSDFNPWGPRFPGDATGLLNIEAVTQTDQKEFHLFEHCRTNKMSTHYQGANAKGGRFYAGIYRCAQSDVQSITVTLNQDDLNETRWAYAEFMVNCKSRQTFYYKHGETKELVPIVPDEVIEEFSEQAKEIHSEEWDKWSDKKKEIAAWEVMLYQRKYDVELVPIVFVRYDEELYDTLVEVGASKGQLSTQHNDLGIF